MRRNLTVSVPFIPIPCDPNRAWNIGGESLGVTFQAYVGYSSGWTFQDIYITTGGDLFIIDSVLPNVLHCDTLTFDFIMWLVPYPGEPPGYYKRECRAPCPFQVFPAPTNYILLIQANRPC